MNHTTIRIEGGLLSSDFLEQVHEQTGQAPADFGLSKNRSLVDEISAVWSDARAYWTAFQRRLDRAAGESTTTITRDQWMIPLLEALGYRLQFQRRAVVVDGKSYALSHRAVSGAEQAAADESDGPDGPPVHIVAFGQELGSRPASGRGSMSPHALVQDYLNRTEDLWAVVTNGRVLRLLRDSTYFSRPSHIEFDLAGMMADERFDEFIFLYRLVHRSRLPQGRADAPDCLLEQYHQAAIEQGGRIRDGLREAVAEALLTLGNGFLRHPRNSALRQRVADSQLSERDYFRQLLYLIYRLLFLMVAEERGLIGNREADDGETGGDGPENTLPASPTYYRFLSITRLRSLAQEPLSAPGRFDDLYLGFRTLAHLMRDETLAGPMGLQALNGELFTELADLDHAFLNNDDFLRTVGLLSHFTPADEKLPRRVNYAALDVEELGSVYESLLDEHPVIDEVRGRYEFAFVQGTERKTTGSYYTPRELVAELIKSALEPVMADRLAEARKQGSAERSPTRPIAQSPEEAALLSLRVVDPACGSGHFLLAAARRIGRELARVRTGEDEPAPERVRAATRDAITHCIYGVDKNPLAVDLCKVALWIEGHSAARPLTFLDYRIRCGDSLVGVLDLGVLGDGIPDEAFTPVTGDDKTSARNLKARNREERGGQLGLFGEAEAEDVDLMSDWRAFVDLPEETPAQVRTKRAAYDRFLASEERTRLEMACHLWTAPFFAEFTGQAHTDERISTTGDLRAFRRGQTLEGRKPGYAQKLASRHQFFHWPLAFPGVFGRGGFDVVLGNPPWERIKLQEKEWFATRAPNIAQARNAAERRKQIAELESRKPALFEDFQAAKHEAEGSSNFARNSGRFPLCGRGDINTYTVFSELARNATNPRGRTGIIVPSGIATDDTTKYFFSDLMVEGCLASLHSFENEEKVFPTVHNQMKFCLLTMTGKERPIEEADFVFFARNVDHLREQERHFALSAKDIALINPNSGTCATFRSKRDAEITKSIYRRVPVLITEGEDEVNPWTVSFVRQFDMANDSNLFVTSDQLLAQGCRQDGNVYENGSERFLPLYEAKLFYHFDHRYSTYADATQAELNAGRLPKTSEEQKADPDFVAMPRYWVREEAILKRVDFDERWYLAFRDVTNTVNERTSIFSLVPWSAVGHKAPLVTFGQMSKYSLGFLANTNSYVFDYVARQKLGGMSMSYFILKQLPALNPETYLQSCSWVNSDHAPHLTYHAWLLPRVLELTYTAWDLAPFAEDVLPALGDHPYAQFAAGHAPLAPPPFRWDEARRFLLRCELDAAFFHLYSIERDDVAYILDTFPIVKRKDEAAYGEYRTQRVILEIYDELARSTRTGVPYRTRLSPPAGDPGVCHPPKVE